MQHTKRTHLLPVAVATLGLAGCAYIPPIKFQDQRYGKDSPSYWTKDPNRNPHRPRELTEEELKGKN